MTDQLKRLRDRCAELRGTVDGWPNMLAEIDRLLAEEPAKPVTDAEVDAAISALDSACRCDQMFDGQDEVSVSDVIEARTNLRALIARKVAEASADREEILGALGLHPDTPTATVLAHLESVRAEARCSADARQLGRAEASARAEALAAAADNLLLLDVFTPEHEATTRRLLRDALAAYRRGGAS